MKKTLTTSASSPWINPRGFARAARAAALLAGLVSQSVLPASAAGQENVPASLTLPEALEIALWNNPRVQAVRNDIAVADWNLNSAYGALLPSASLNSSVSWQGAGEQRFGSITADQLGFGDQPSFLFSSYNAGVNFSLSGRTLMAPGQARRNRDATRAQVRTAEANLRLNVTRAYLEVLRQIEGLSLAEQELARAELNLRLARGRQEVGSGSAIDVHQAEVSVGRAEITLLQSRTGVRNARVRLLQNLGVNLNAEPSLATSFAVTEPPWTVDALYQMAVSQNPDLQALRAGEESARYGVRMAWSSYLPSLSVSAGFSGFTRQASSTAGTGAGGDCGRPGGNSAVRVPQRPHLTPPQPPSAAELFAPCNPRVGAGGDPRTEYGLSLRFYPPAGNRPRSPSRFRSSRVWGASVKWRALARCCTTTRSRFASRNWRCGPISSLAWRF